MKYTKTYYSTKCPSANDFQLYLNGTAGADLILAFENHLNDCELCCEAIAGYKSVVLSKTVIKYPSALIKWIGYAAAIVIFVGSASLLLFHNQSLNRNQLAENYSYEQISPSNKKLSHKSTTEYMYFGKNQVVEVNDQIVNTSHTAYTKPANTQTEQVIIEIEELSAENQQLINSIKTNSNIPVYTFSKTKGFKNN